MQAALLRIREVCPQAKIMVWDAEYEGEGFNVQGHVQFFTDAMVARLDDITPEDMAEEGEAYIEAVNEVCFDVMMNIAENEDEKGFTFMNIFVTHETTKREIFSFGIDNLPPTESEIMAVLETVCNRFYSYIPELANQIAAAHNSL